MPNRLQQQEFQQFANLDLLAKQIVEGFVTGLHQSPFHGFSVEFAEHRLYNTGESVKNIDWKLFAKTDKLFVKQFEEETNLRGYLILDTSSSMHYPANSISKLQFSVYAAAAMMYIFKRQRDAVGLGLFNEKVEFLSKAKSTSAHLHYLFATLESTLKAPSKNSKTNISQSLHYLAEQLNKRAMVIIFSDMLENAMDEKKSSALFSALQHLKFNKHEVLIFNVTDHQEELAFNFENRPYEFIDLESKEQMRIHPNEVRQVYIQAVMKYRNLLSLKCAQYKIDLVDANIQEGYNQVLKHYLIKRNSMV